MNNSPAPQPEQETPPRADNGNAKVHPTLATGGAAAKQLLSDTLSNQLVSLCIIGHPVEEGLLSGEMIKTVAVVQGDLFATANRLSRLSKKLTKHRLSAPLLMTTQYIDESLDAFPVEFLNMQLLHSTIHGPDPFVSLQFERSHVRLQCERDSKRYLLHIRQGIIHGRGTSTAIRDLLHELFSAAMSLFSAVLFLKDVQRPRTRAQTISITDDTMDFTVKPFSQVLSDIKHEKTIPNNQLEHILRESYEVMLHLAEWINAKS